MGVYVGFDVGKSFEEGRQAFDADTPAVVRRWGDTTYVVDVIVGDYSAYNSQVFTLCYLDNSFNIPARINNQHLSRLKIPHEINKVFQLYSKIIYEVI